MRLCNRYFGRVPSYAAHYRDRVRMGIPGIKKSRFMFERLTLIVAIAVHVQSSHVDWCNCGFTGEGVGF